MQCIVVKSGEFENSYSLLYIFFLNPVYVAARSLCSLRSNKNVYEGTRIRQTTKMSANFNWSTLIFSLRVQAYILLVQNLDDNQWQKPKRINKNWKHRDRKQFTFLHLEADSNLSALNVLCRSWTFCREILSDFARYKIIVDVGCVHIMLSYNARVWRRLKIALQYVMYVVIMNSVWPITVFV